ncbi:MAG TPA: sulfotransferase [Persephonella sp.]|nr:sulfotransferase [Persephonella sp.]
MEVTYKHRTVVLPDFLIVGAMKSGTTSLYNWLKTHPQIYLPDETKEPRFFVCVSHPHYYKHWPYKYELRCNIEDYSKLFLRAKREQKIGEASVAYLHSFDIAIENIKKFYRNRSEELKVIIILRNPIDRLISHYTAALAAGEKQSLKEAFEIEKELLKDTSMFRGNIEKLIRNNKKMTSEDFFFWTSKYYVQVKAYINEFPRIKVYLYEDLTERPLLLLKDIFKFLDIDDRFIPPNLGVPYNPSGIPKSPLHKLVYRLLISYNPLKPLAKKLLSEEVSYKIAHKLRKNFYIKPEIPPSMRKKLLDIFREDILKLQDLIGRDLSHWLEE